MGTPFAPYATMNPTVFFNTAAQWTAQNRVLGLNEWGIEISAAEVGGVPGLMKVGDGVTAWADLAYWPPGIDADVIGPASALDNAAAVFDSTTGKLIKDGSGVNVLLKRSVESYATTATAAGTTTLTVASVPVQEFTGVTTQTVVLPVVTTLIKTGFDFFIINNSSGTLTINSSGANLVQTLLAGQRAIITCILLTGTSAASWSTSVLPNTSPAGIHSFVGPVLGTPASGVLTNCTGTAAGLTAGGNVPIADILRNYLATTVTYNNTAALADTALSVTVAASGKYAISLVVHSTSAVKGLNMDFGGTATFTNFIGEWQLATDSSDVAQLRVTAAGTDFGPAGADATSGPYYTFTGSCEINAGGTFLLRGGQNAADVSNTTILAGSTLILTKTN